MARLPETITKLYEDGTITITPLHKHKGNLSELAKEERRKRLTEIGNIKKVFRFSSMEKRKVKSSAIRLWHTKKNSVKWFTLTFSKPLSEEISNQCLSKFLDNLNKNYELNNYVIVREHENKEGNYFLHYHCLCDIPFVDFRVLNNSWNRACRDHMPYSLNALTSGKKKIIDNIQGIVAYISKYITKSKDVESSSRVYFISRNTESTPAIINFNNYVYLTTSFECFTIVKDHFTITFLKNFAYLPEMFLIKMNKKQKKPPKLVKIPDSIQPNLNF